ncbi:TIR domain-containing protein [Peribacillus asahii]|uniref:TIR domain-containing protein n=1 Tax=Peribacillus asahii TaxID=228899 RepID=UPI00382CB32A
MPGITKRKYVGETLRINKKMKGPLKKIIEILPYEYNASTLLELFKELYPFEWQEINQRYQHYKKKDEFLLKQGKKVRYKPVRPEIYFVNLPIIRNVLTDSRIEKHKLNFDEKSYLEKLDKLRYKRKSAINQRSEKINKATELIQNVEPLYIDVFIAAYHKKGLTVEGKLEIFKELQKYNSPKTIDFFYKLNDSEKNNQIRNMAFKHLQDIGKYVKLRKKFKGKQKAYMTDKSQFYMSPLDLLERIESNNVQNLKVFDVFISHSFKDSTIIKKIIKVFNKHSINIYCDWTSDNDFLKRELISDYTKVVLKKRLEQSRNLVFVKTENSILSDWVSFELDYFKSLGKAIYCINLFGEANENHILLEYDAENETISWE